MLFSVIEDKLLNAIFVKSRGVFDPTQVGHLIQTISGLPIYQDDVRILHDLRDVTFDLAMDKVLRVVHARRQKMCMRRLALVHDGELGFGMCRAIASMNDLNSRRTEAFREESRAVSWLFTEEGVTDLPSHVVEAHKDCFEREPVTNIAEASPSQISFARS